MPGRLPPVAAIPELLRKRREVEELRRFTRARRLVSLTYDDGPSHGLTRAIAALLDSYGVYGTFFMLGSRAAAAPEVADELHAAGHEIGCHSGSHLHAWRSSTRESIEDIEQGYRDLGRWISKEAVFRPPYGKLLPGTRRRAMRDWGPIGWWTVDSGDTWPSVPRVDEIVARIISDGGGVVLMHDFERTSRVAAAVHEYVLALTEALIRASVRHGFEIRTLGAILSEQRGSI